MLESALQHIACNFEASQGLWNLPSCVCSIAACGWALSYNHSMWPRRYKCVDRGAPQRTLYSIRIHAWEWGFFSRFILHRGAKWCQMHRTCFSEHNNISFPPDVQRILIYSMYSFFSSCHGSGPVNMTWRHPRGATPIKKCLDVCVKYLKM